MSFSTSAPKLPSLEKYEVLEELGHGGMAVVYRARDVRLDREVAVKVIHSHLRESAEVARRFAAEARAVAKLRHPNIIEVYDVSAEEEGERYLVVELSRGQSLRKMLGHLGALPPEVSAALGIELASALSHAHGAGVIHRDVKPENVLVDASGGEVQVKLTDFGIAKILDAQGVTSTGQVLGSPAHMAPEQIEGAEVDARSDVFALGVLLYECMVGHLPFEGSNPAQVLRKVLEGMYSAAERENPLVGSRWGKILAGALAREPAGRFATVDLCGQALAGELSRLEVADHKGELRRFFADPERYRAELGARIVPVLTRRGEAARRSGDVVGAASDFNRALAYAPRDAELLRLILATNRGAAWRAAARKGFVALSGLVVLGVLWTAGASLLRPPAALRRGGVNPSPSTPGIAAPGALADVSSVAPPASGAARPSSVGELAPRAQPPVGLGSSNGVTAALARSSSPERPRRSSADPAETPVAFRNVHFFVSPQGARVGVDDQPDEDLSFGRLKRLSVGRHAIRARVPESRCCKALSKVYEIVESPGDEPQEIRLSLSFNDAELAISGAPNEALVRCPLLRISGAADRGYHVPMSALDQDVLCDLVFPGLAPRTTSVRLRAGELTSVPWQP